MKTFTQTLEHVSIALHPKFKEPRNDWRVRPEYYEFDYDDEGDKILETKRFVPEDRSQWRPEEDGKAMADFWDFDKAEFKEGSPCPLGVKTFLQPVSKITYFEESPVNPNYPTRTAQDLEVADLKRENNAAFQRIQELSAELVRLGYDPTAKIPLCPS